MLKLVNKSYRCLRRCESYASEKSSCGLYFMPKLKYCKPTSAPIRDKRTSAEVYPACDKEVPSDINKNEDFYCDFIARAHSKLNSNSKKKIRMKRSWCRERIDEDRNEESCSLRSTSLLETACDSSNEILGLSDNYMVEDMSCSDSSDEQQQMSYNVPDHFRIWEKDSSLKTNSDMSYDTMLNFQVLSYNVLAQTLLESHPYLYRHCSPGVLRWRYRANLLFNEINKLSPEIICLQEVQESHIDSFYSLFETLGYRGVYKQKTGDRNDGCAIYFKDSIFELKDHLDVEFLQPHLPILNRDNIGLMVKLSPRSNPNINFVVATTHLLYNPSRADVRLAQMQVFLAEIDRFAYADTGNKRSAGTIRSHVPIILTGDLNSQPHTAVPKLLSTGYVESDALRDSSDWRRIGVTDHCQHIVVYDNRQKGKNDSDTTKLHNSRSTNPQPFVPDITFDSLTKEHDILFNTDKVKQFLSLKSVYDHVKPDHQREATTYQDEWVTVDYIYYSSGNKNTGLKLLERLRLPTANECKLLRSLPNKSLGSDHLLLAARFQLNALNAKHCL